jgi:RNA polymerase sigma-70 factor (ECF subfamily)
MRPTAGSFTSPSLIGRLHRNPGDPEAWNDFVRRYGRKIYTWCRYWNLQDADAQDVTQKVLLEISRKMRTFVYDPSRSFRGWLKTLARAAWCDYLAARRAHQQGSGDDAVHALLQSIADRDDFARKIEDMYDLELLEAATIQVRFRINPHTWEIFRRLVYEEHAGVEVAAQMKIRVSAVYMAKSRVQKLLKEEIAKLEQASGSAQ